MRLTTKALPSQLTATAARAFASRRAPYPVPCCRLTMAAASSAGGSTVFGNVPQAPPDPILGVTEAFKACTAAEKLNLGVGAYRDDNLKPVVLEVVKHAEQQLLQRELAGTENKEYLSIEGLPAFNRATAELLFGADSQLLAQGRVVTVQGLSVRAYTAWLGAGTGSLRLGAAFIARFLPGRVVYISDPTWGNHKNIFSDEKVEWRTYRYYDPTTVGLDFAGMVADLQAAPEGSIVILHGCAHNPTGIDPTPGQWAQLAQLCSSRRLLPFFDVAYQGFATGDLDADAAAPRLFAAAGLEMFVAQSYSKNLGLYSERVGAINVVLAHKDNAPQVLSQLKRCARGNYSNPPGHGARIVATVVGDPVLFGRWKQELQGMAGRIASVRAQLRAALEARDGAKDWAFVTTQIGMFSFTGLAPAQVENMTAKWHIYMTKDGRISLAGLNSASVDRLADAMVDSFKVKA